ncbi:Uncharacterised protein [Escherichia coli]|nr:Uncharacterised protein [Escherichia coli]CAD5792127.1 Uncharacterised protein [Escherichia coli]
MPKTPRVYVAFCFYICNLNAALAMLGKFLEFAGVLCNLHIEWLIFAQDWWVRNGLSLLNKGLRGYTSANNFL